MKKILLVMIAVVGLSLNVSGSNNQTQNRNNQQNRSSQHTYRHCPAGRILCGMADNISRRDPNGGLTREQCRQRQEQQRENIRRQNQQSGTIHNPVLGGSCRRDRQERW